jgi:hypothetical protein
MAEEDGRKGKRSQNLKTLQEREVSTAMESRMCVGKLITQ